MDIAEILVVDDDRNLLELLGMRLESAGYKVTQARTADEAVKAAGGNAFDLSIVDFQLSSSDGIAVMEELLSTNPGMPVIILTAHGTIESAVTAMKKGAFNYLTKPFDPQNLLLQVERALENRRLTTEVQRLKGLIGERFGFSNIISKSGKMTAVLEQVSHVAGTDSTVYIHGESGTGKELIAKAIHIASNRRERSFVAINCAAIPETLLESELFGHERGAFTGAVRSSKGLFAQAHEGTVFLDEIGDMPLSIQAKFLRVLQERLFYPVGSTKPMEVDIRVIVATNKDLENEVREGRFREDLFYRIHVIPIYLPPLRERKEDIPYLTEHFLKKYSEQMNRKIKGLAPAATQRLMAYDWPGNVRELENAVEYAVAMTQKEVITEDLVLQTKEVSGEPFKPLKEARDAFEKRYLVHLLEYTRGNISRASELAGKYRADFYNLMKKHHIKVGTSKSLDEP